MRGTMKPITLHPVSVLSGLALAGVLVVLAGAAQSPGTAHPIPIREVRLVGEIPADWWTYVELRPRSDGVLIDTYAIPSDRHFVVTLGDFYPTNVQVSADGQDMTAPLKGMNNNETRVPLPPGALLTAGAPLIGESSARLWGYLEPLR